MSQKSSLGSIFRTIRLGLTLIFILSLAAVFVILGSHNQTLVEVDWLFATTEVSVAVLIAILLLLGFLLGLFACLFTIAKLKVSRSIKNRQARQRQPVVTQSE